MMKEREVELLVETEPKKRKPYGLVSKEPFPTILNGILLKRGLTRKDLAEITEMTQGAVCFWFTGRSVPSLKALGALLIALRLDDDEVDELTEAYGCELSKGRGVSRVNSLELSRLLIKPSESPVGKWIEEQCIERNITVTEGMRLLKLTSKRSSVRDSFGLETLIRMQQNAPWAFKLSEEEIEILNRAIQDQISTELEKRHRFVHRGKNGLTPEERKTLNYHYYNFAEVAETLGTSREWIRILCRKFNFVSPLTRDQIKKLETHLAETKDLREKRQNTRRKSREVTLYQAVS